MPFFNPATSTVSSGSEHEVRIYHLAFFYLLLGGVCLFVVVVDFVGGRYSSGCCWRSIARLLRRGLVVFVWRDDSCCTFSHHQLSMLLQFSGEEHKVPDEYSDKVP